MKVLFFRKKGEIHFSKLIITMYKHVCTKIVSNNDAIIA